MATSSVKIPITGYAVVEVEHVEGLSDNEIIALAMDSEITVGNFEEWDIHRAIVEGNVFYGSCNRAEVEWTDDDNED